MTPTEDTKQRLLDAAAQVFAEKGFAEATVREICNRAKANIAAVNYYFRDKEQLYAETLRRAHCMRVENMGLPQWPEDTPPERKLKDFLHGMVFSFADDTAPPWFIQLMLREITQPSKAGIELVKEFIRPQFELLQGIITELVGEDVPAMKRHMIGFSIVGQCLYYKVARHVALTLVGGEEFAQYDVERLTQHIYEFSLAAMGHTSHKEPPARTRKKVTA
jgi:TetR/AcrR family transcriptional regulator, regulator of cefoperazone and chloramphenicol sensitivity